MMDRKGQTHPRESASGWRAAWALLAGALACLPGLLAGGCGSAQPLTVAEQLAPLLEGAADVFVADPKAVVPAKFDWRSHGGDFTTPAKNQRPCEACWAFAISGTLEMAYKVAMKDPNLTPDFSEQQLVSCTVDETGADGGGCRYFDVGKSLDFIKRNGGMAEESYFPYQKADVACAGLRSGWEKSAIQLESWTSVSKDTASIKQKVLEGPVLAKMIYYEDFRSYTAGVYEHTWGVSLGTHCVVILGWDDADQSWIAKNSIGADWGMNGFFKIRWGNSSIQDENAFFVNLPKPSCSCVDQDGDGYYPISCQDEKCPARTDCDDQDKAVHPGAAEVCSGGKDEDCDGQVDGNDSDCPSPGPSPVIPGADPTGQNPSGAADPVSPSSPSTSTSSDAVLYHGSCSHGGDFSGSALLGLVFVGLALLRIKRKETP